MNREIKFRAWDKIEKKFIYSSINDDINDDSREYYPFCFFVGYKQRKDLILMQFTGLKDKNGKEIYEGDILETDEGGVIEIFYDLASFNSKILKHSSICMNNYLYNWYCISDQSKIIGNIYENPYLIK